MLSPGERTREQPPNARQRALAQAWLPCSRGLPLPTLAAVAGLAAAPTLLVLARHGRDMEGALVAAALVCGAAAAFTAEDPAEETLSASPTSLARRRLLRLSALTLGVAVVGMVLVAVAATVPAGTPSSDLGRRTAELLATSGLAAAAAGAAHRCAVPGAAAGGAVAGVLGLLLVSALAQRFHWLPAILESPHHARWWLAAAVGWSVTAWTWRDPGRR